MAWCASHASAPIAGSGRRFSRRSVAGGSGWLAGRFGFGGLGQNRGGGGRDGFSFLGFCQPRAALLVELFEQAGGSLEIINPPAHHRLQVGRDMDRGRLAPTSLPQAKREVARAVVASAATGRLAASAGHHDEAAVEKTLGFAEQLMKTAARMTLRGGQRSGGKVMPGHGILVSFLSATSTYSRCQRKKAANANAKMLACFHPLVKPPIPPEIKGLAGFQIFPFRNR